jgi:dihydrodipicolinate synthase/N-acetylneuraminate lyase
MKTSAVTVADLRGSVLSVPPLARKADYSLDAAANATMVAHLRAGGVTTHLWGGNANLYNMSLSEFPAFLKMAEDLAVGDEWAIPSIGPDFGKAMDQADILSKTKFPTAMILPMRFPATPKGVAKGVGKVAEKFGRGLILYVKDDGYIAPEDIGALVREGAVACVKYGTVKDNPADDPALAAILRHVDVSLVISGSGERPIVAHGKQFGIRAFTSGSVCLAPKLSTACLAALSRGDWATIEAIWPAFEPLESLRDGFSPLRVLHVALGLGGLAEMGPMLPMLSDIDDPKVLADIKAAARSLLAANAAAPARAAAE